MDCGRSASTISSFPSRMGPSFDSNKGNGMAKAECPERASSRVLDAEPDVDIDLRELYFLIMHFLSSGPCEKTFRQLSDELLEHQLLPRRYHAWFSRSGMQTGSVDDDGISFPLNYFNLVDRYGSSLPKSRKKEVPSHSEKPFAPTSETTRTPNEPTCSRKGWRESCSSSYFAGIWLLFTFGWYINCSPVDCAPFSVIKDVKHVGSIAAYYN